MTPAPDIKFTLRSTDAERRVAAAIDAARLAYWEEPERGLQTAVHAQERARTLGNAALQSRALALQSAVAVHRGDLPGAFDVIADAERLAGADVQAQAEIAAVNTHLHFFSGSYAESLRQAEIALELADATNDLALRLHVRRMACVAVCNVGVPDLEERLELALALAVEAGSPWEEAVIRNDLATHRLSQDDAAGAAEHLERALALAAGLVPRNSFVLSLVHCTRAELHLQAGATPAAEADARRAVAYITASGDPNPYLLGMCVLMEVRALLGLDRVEDARAIAEAALAELGERVPHARSMILSEVAAALREAGRSEQAYDMLARCAELEREALREYSSLQLGLERARLEMTAARRQADALAVKNRQLHDVVAELAEARDELQRRTTELELLRDQLREQADRDFLTGLVNRRYLARARAEPGSYGSLAITDIDHFKSINDRFGHHVGDQVLVRVAELLTEHLRTEDVVARIGGEEFAVLMPGASPQEAAACCERLREVIEAEPWTALAPGLAVTASFGIASADGEDDLGALEREADARLYAAKRAGRNRVEAR